ncbi:hydantoin racemase family [Protomyces lactucae-debilis]|uniref:Hydantoin racemase family n=1 Tax=Protomyces lactucae-debilis TaxID=2754530 RepID=A0A1Y2EXY5_PROLT|nr:hydantoin racemase family [Protomyces lactucae-debilis]ORY76347.1 hydantoin racemase family [Protomyces lactucae-debilis]
MRILIINPNSTKDITRTLVAALPRYEGVLLHTLDAPVPAPAAIQSAVTSIASAFYSFKAILPTLAEYDGFLVCCYSAHPLVEMLRESTTAPVVGIMQASLVTGLQLGNKVGIVTTAERWQPLLTNAVASLGFDTARVQVSTTGLGVLDLHAKPQTEVHALVAARALELVRDGCEVIALGCAGMTGLERAVTEAVGPGVPVVDGVAAGYEQLLALCRMKLQTSKALLYA